MHVDELKLTILEKRRLRRDLIEVYKLLTGKENIDHTVLLKLDDSCYGTRGHKYKLNKYISRWTFWSTSSATDNRVVSNSLPSHVVHVHADTFLTAKKRLDVCNEWGIQSWWSFSARHQQWTMNEYSFSSCWLASKICEIQRTKFSENSNL